MLNMPSYWNSEFYDPITDTLDEQAPEHLKDEYIKIHKTTKSTYDGNLVIT